MKKIIAIIIICLIIIATVIVLGFVWDKKATVESTTVSGGAKVVQQQVKEVKPAEETSIKSSDADIQAIESDLNSVNDEDFSDATLSDSEVGL